MADTIKLLFLLGLNVGLMVSGVVAIRRKQFSIGLGGRGTRPLFTITLTGIGATVFGITYIIGGVVTFIPTIMYIFSRDAALLETAMTIAVAAALILIVGGFIVGAIFQLVAGVATKTDKEKE